MGLVVVGLCLLVVFFFLIFPLAFELLQLKKKNPKPTHTQQNPIFLLAVYLETLKDEGVISFLPLVILLNLPDGLWWLYAGWCMYIWARLRGRMVSAAVILVVAARLTWVDLISKSKAEWNFMKEGNKIAKEIKMKCQRHSGTNCAPHSCLPTDST